MLTNAQVKELLTTRTLNGLYLTEELPEETGDPYVDNILDAVWVHLEAVEQLGEVLRRYVDERRG